MYTESRNNFSLRNVILQFLFIALFVFILIWLFPTKKDMKKATNNSSNDEKITINNNDLSILYDRIFNENLMSMKEAAQSYYTTERLPQKVGDSTKITLREMLDKKIILPFKDKNGKQCDLDASYVQITKNENEYVMKVNLKCGDEENYLLTYMGCYDYCSKTICEKKGYVGKVYNVPTTTTPKKTICKVVNGKYYDKNGNVVSKSSYEKSCEGTPEKTVDKKYYCKVVNGKYYDKNGNVVSESAYIKSCLPEVEKTYYCKVVNGKYYDKTGKVVNKEAYEKSCTTPVEKHYCEIINGKYYDKSGNVVTESAYIKSCLPEVEKTYYCKVVNGKYYDKTGKVVNKETYEKSCEEPVQPQYRYLYEYKKVVDGSYKYGEWSEWSTAIVNPSSTIEVQQKTQTIKKHIGYNVTKVNDLTKPIFSSQKVLVGTTTVKVCDSYNVTSTVTGYQESYVGTVKLTSAPTSTSTTRYEAVGTYNWYCDNDCTSGTVYLYKVYQRKPVTSTSYSCSKYSTYTQAYEATKTVLTGYEKKEVKEPVYETYTKVLYRYRTKTKTPGESDIKWSTYNDMTLLNANYHYTGNIKIEVISK